MLELDATHTVMSKEVENSGLKVSELRSSWLHPYQPRVFRFFDFARILYGLCTNGKTRFSYVRISITMWLHREAKFQLGIACQWDINHYQ